LAGGGEKRSGSSSWPSESAPRSSRLEDVRIGAGTG